MLSMHVRRGEKVILTHRRTGDELEISLVDVFARIRGDRVTLRFASDEINHDIQRVPDETCPSVHHVQRESSFTPLCQKNSES